MSRLRWMVLSSLALVSVVRADAISDLKKEVDQIKAQLAALKSSAEAPKVALLDINAVAKALGRDQEVVALAEAARQNLVGQLQKLAGDRRKEILGEQAKVDDAKSKLGEKPKADDEKKFQELVKTATTKVQQLQSAQNANITEANTKYSQYRSALLVKFKDEIRPFASRIAKARGAVVVFLPSEDMMLFEPAVDITPDVIVAMRGNIQPWVKLEPKTAPLGSTDGVVNPAPGAKDDKKAPAKK